MSRSKMAIGSRMRLHLCLGSGIRELEDFGLLTLLTNALIDPRLSGSIRTCVT